MILALTASADGYITNRYIGGISRTRSNTGRAGTLDIFKLYGVTSTVVGTGSVPNREISRALIKFDLEPLRRLVSAGTISLADSTFSANMKLYNSNGGQSIPENFTLSVHPLSASFDEGRGRDIALFNDVDSCNWLTSSVNPLRTWVQSGAGASGSAGQSVDILTDIGSQQVSASQRFVTGLEDLSVNVTPYVSCTLAGIASDNGFRLSFSSVEEDDEYTYFVKRFASRHTYDKRLQPKLFITYDDSVLDDSPAPLFSVTGTYAFTNSLRGRTVPFTSASVQITGSSRVNLRLVNRSSGSATTYIFPGASAVNRSAGTYLASGSIVPTQHMLEQLTVSGSVKFESYWESVDGTVSYATGSNLRFRTVALAPTVPSAATVVNVTGASGEIEKSNRITMTCFIDDPFNKSDTPPSRTPRASKTVLYRDVHYQIREKQTGNICVPIDTVTNSTRMSNDEDRYYFTLPTSCLSPGIVYVVDVVIWNGTDRVDFKSASGQFWVVE